MAVTPEQVKQAQQAVSDAQQHADQLQKAADASRDAAQQSQTAADGARDAANAADQELKTKASEAARQRADANTATGVCQRGQSSAAAAQDAAQRAAASAKATHAQYPGACSPETDAAEEAEDAAQSRLEAAEASRDTSCAEAEQKRQAADSADADAATAKADADSAHKTADSTHDQAEKDEQKAQADQAAAQRAVAAIALAQSAYKQLKAELDAQIAAAAHPVTPGPTKPPPPHQPNHANSAAHSGQRAPATHGPGTTGSSLFDLNLTGGIVSWKLSEGWEKAAIVLETTEGYKHRYTGGGQYTLVAGARTEELGGTETKVTIATDWRQINTRRYERTFGLKAESVLGSVHQTTYLGETRQTPAIRQDKDAKSFAGNGPESESISKRAIHDFKKKAYDKYLEVQVKAKSAKLHCDDAFVHADNWNRTITTFNQEIEDHTAKFKELEQQCKNFKIKSSSFIKMIASSGMKLTSGKLKGTIKSKVKAMADSMAEFKGDVKLGG